MKRPCFWFGIIIVIVVGRDLIKVNNNENLEIAGYSLFSQKTWYENPIFPIK